MSIYKEYFEFDIKIPKDLKEKLANLGAIIEDDSMQELIVSLLEEYTNKTRVKRYTKEEIDAMQTEEYRKS